MCSQKFRKIHRKTPVEESRLRPAILLKKRLWHGSFPVKFAKFLRAAFSQNTSSGCFCKVCKLFWFQRFQDLTLYHQSTWEGVQFHLSTWEGVQFLVHPFFVYKIFWSFYPVEHLCFTTYIRTFSSSHRRCSRKNAVIKNFTIFIGKQLCWSLFLI